MCTLSTSRNDGLGDPDSVQVTRYDLHLLAIPTALLLSVLAHFLVGVALEVALLAGSLIGAVVVIDAVFRHPPTRRRGAV